VRIRNLLLIGLLLTAIGLSACGRRGPLEAPPGEGSNDEKPTVLDPLIQ
jgi:predicted small lipoprotein YifL